MKVTHFFTALIFFTLTISNLSCKKDCEGCTNKKAQNYNPDATIDDGNCLIKGCTNKLSENYDPEANVDDGSCVIKGCMDKEALNFNPFANTEDNSCKYEKDQFIGNYSGKLSCKSPFLGFLTGQTLDITIEEIPGEKKKVKLSLGLAIPGIESPIGIIEGKRLTYSSPEQKITVPIGGNNTEFTISNFGELTSPGLDPNTLTGTITIKAKSGLLINIEDTCTLEATRK
jgi:hypothetical protein